MSHNLTHEEIKGLAEVIDGTLESMLQDVEWDHEDVGFWITILRKLGSPAEFILDSWVESAADEGFQI